jgi:hypothetical protein
MDHDIFIYFLECDIKNIGKTLFLLNDTYEFFMDYFVSVFGFCCVGDGTQGFVRARQVLTTKIHPQPFTDTYQIIPT